MNPSKVTTQTFLEMKANKQLITMLTSYDYPMAKLVDESGIEGILVGDSVGNVILGYDSTIPVTVDEMLHHVKAVTRGTKRALVVADMPFLSYQISVEEAIRSAGRFIKEGGAHAVKIEGGEHFCAAIEALVSSGIPVMGHLGLTPQSINQLGGYKVQGRDIETAYRLVTDALALQKSGAFSVVLECVPRQIAEIVTNALEIPTIGIGAGTGCDGQILVTHDLLGLLPAKPPKFVKRYADIGNIMIDSVKAYISEVKQGIFPSLEYTYGVSDDVVAELKARLNIK